MLARSDDLDRFLRAVHRRWVAVRVAEAMGVGVVIGSALALMVLPIVLWRGEPAMPVVWMTTGIAAFVGMIAGVIRRPDVMSAAAEADRQLDLADLLSTALAMRECSAEDPWAALVVATAGARCRTLAPSAVIVNRFGGRAWGGIGLATALVLTLGLLSADPRQSAAVARLNDDGAISDEVTPFRAKGPSASVAGNARQRTHATDDVTERASERDGSDDVASLHANDQASRAMSASDGGGGAGLATSSREPTAPAPQLPLSPAASRDNRAGDASTGGAASAASAASDQVDEASLGTTVTTPRAAAAPVWRSAAWPAARDQALAAVRDGTIRDSHRDLVRDYFNAASD